MEARTLRSRRSPIGRERLRANGARVSAEFLARRARVD